MIAAIISGLAIVWGIPIVTAAVGLWQPILIWVLLPLGLAWVLYFGAKSRLIACPQCGRSVFMRAYGTSVPWPARRCDKCGRDLTID